MFEKQAQRAAEAMSRKDLAAVMHPWAEDGVFEMAGQTELSGRYEGKAAIESLFLRIFERIDTITFTVRRVGLVNPFGFTYNNTIFIESDVDQTSADGVTTRDRRITVYEWRHGKLVGAREWFLDPTITEAIWGHAAARTAV